MKRKTPTIVSIAILTVITIFMWIAFSVYRVLTTEPPINIPPEILAPISPTLDKDVLASLPSKSYFEDGSVSPTFVFQGQVANQSFSLSPTPITTLTLTPSPTSVATGSGQITP